jgi:ribosomal protein S18 acetylase RimI-like enzyme
VSDQSLHIYTLQINPSPFILSSHLSTKRDKKPFFSIFRKDFTQKIKLQISNFKQRESHTTTTAQPTPHIFHLLKNWMEKTFEVLEVADSISLNSFIDHACEEFYLSTTGSGSAYSDHLILAKDASTGLLIGACEGNSFFGGACCSRLAVSREWRYPNSKGVGKALLSALAAEAQKAPAKASVIHLCTLDYQGVNYYPRLGFQSDYVLTGLPNGRRITYFSRAIGEGSVAGLEEVRPDQELKQQTDGYVIEKINSIDNPVEFAAIQEDTLRFLRSTFVQHSLETINAESGWFSFSYEAVSSGLRVGGVTGMGYFGNLVISLLMVLPEHRSRGIGEALVAAAIKRGQEKGCTRCVVETMTFQAPLFYTKKLGFVEAGVVRGFKDGSSLLRFVKNI